jgi:hypothetical protein
MFNSYVKLPEGKSVVSIDLRSSPKIMIQTWIQLWEQCQVVKKTTQLDAQISPRLLVSANGLPDVPLGGQSQSVRKWWMKSPDMAKKNMGNEVLNHQKGCSLRVQTNLCNWGQPPGRMKDGAGEVASRFC